MELEKRKKGNPGTEELARGQEYFSLPLLLGSPASHLCFSEHILDNG